MRFIQAEQCDKNQIVYLIIILILINNKLIEMLRVSTKITRVLFSSNKFIRPPQQFDAANALGINEVGEPIMSLGEKLSYFKPSIMYESLDQFSRELLFTFSENYSLGISGSIICISLIIKGIFMYPTLMAQFNGIKMQSIKGQMTKMNEKIKLGRMTNNVALMRQAQKQFNDVRKKRGIDNFITLLNLFQIPLMITWFLSLRYVTNLPQIYPTIQTEGILWFTDLSAYDPYFLLPILSAIATSLSIIYSPSLSNSMSINPILGQFAKYLKFLPFASLPITGMFPAAINLYWLTMASSQLFIVMLTRSKFLQHKYGVYKQIQQATTFKAVIIQQKEKVKNSQALSQQNTQKDQKIILTTSKKPKKKKQ